jgi:hypothetical protein
LQVSALDNIAVLVAFRFHERNKLLHRDRRGIGALFRELIPDVLLGDDFVVSVLGRAAMGAGVPRGRKKPIQIVMSKLSMPAGERPYRRRRPQGTERRT